MGLGGGGERSGEVGDEWGTVQHVVLSVLRKESVLGRVNMNMAFSLRHRYASSGLISSGSCGGVFNSSRRDVRTSRFLGEGRLGKDQRNPCVVACGLRIENSLV